MSSNPNRMNEPIERQRKFREPYIGVYRLIVNRCAYYYVHATHIQIEDYIALIRRICPEMSVSAERVEFSDFDEINHNHFC